MFFAYCNLQQQVVAELLQYFSQGSKVNVLCWCTCTIFGIKRVQYCVPYCARHIQVYFPILEFISIFIYMEIRIIFGFNVGLKQKTASQNLSINTR
jgi:hypothetical protein